MVKLLAVPTGAFPPWPLWLRRICTNLHWLVLAAGCALAATGCAGWHGHPFQAAYQPHNIYLRAPTLPAQLRRVAVLPLTSAANDYTAIAGRSDLQPVLLAELAKRHAFEIVVVSPEELATLTHQPAWNAADKLPLDLLANLKAKTGCDGVFFGQLTNYRPYLPLVIGWKLTLVDCDHGTVWWAADEVFDASQPAVATAAVRYDHQHAAASVVDYEGYVLSPRGFAQYTTSVLFATLPSH